MVIEVAGNMKPIVAANILVDWKRTQNDIDKLDELWNKKMGI